MKKMSKKEAEQEIKDFFKHIKGKTPKDIKKIKRLAMKHNIKLGSLRRKFCKKCFSAELKIRKIKKDMKTTECRNCGKVNRWKIN